MNAYKKEAFTGWLFIMPAIIGFGLLTVIPIIFSLVISFTDWNFMEGLKGIRFTGFHNYTQMWSDQWFTDSLKNNLIFAVTTVPLIMIFSLLTAVGLNHGAFFKTPLRMIIFMPYVSSIVAVSLVWALLYSPSQGPINQALRRFGIEHPPGWLSDPKWALAAIIIMSVWAAIGYNMVIYLAGLQSIPKDLYEASSIDGAGKVRQFFSVTIPLLSPTTFFVLITCIIHSFQVFAAIFMMTQGGPGTSTSVLTFYIYQTGFSFYKMGYASAMAWILTLIIFLVTIVQWIGQKRWVNY
ncbi:carbohydrate ABC transporter permease [Paenibacillus allorhizosphaerae]|uniref:Lactose transport system permease protein LacF n=1 Tax=Paenibacillus allorhizosphaerae TaxID=2849866 RepID=A0ABM8VGV5_9BACL|nr:sugar ABC transporter permease [Paenibacillus allorhizosphaerae]CAG7639908.1 Lactose transport system permease protein LacF [Paenibacillus allorhizosphaerae]